MPPTRGHDLKRWRSKSIYFYSIDAPHTGARLETWLMLLLLKLL